MTTICTKNQNLIEQQNNSHQKLIKDLEKNFVLSFFFYIYNHEKRY